MEGGYGPEYYGQEYEESDVSPRFPSITVMTEGKTDGRSAKDIKPSSGDDDRRIKISANEK